MQGAGNDFVVLDETPGLYPLTERAYRFLADRHYGVGADQILSVRRSHEVGIDFEYVIHNADGQEVEHCGNGARCFARYVHDRGLSHASSIRVRIKKGLIEPVLLADGDVKVDMGCPVFAEAEVPFLPQHARRLSSEGALPLWQLDLANGEQVDVGVVSMGNPHAVTVVPEVASAPVGQWGPLTEHHMAFPSRVNAGYMQVNSRSAITLRVFERGAGETLACGTGACAAVVVGIRQGLLDTQVDVKTRGGDLRIAWSGDPRDSVWMTGPATTVFEGVVEVPDDLLDPA